MRRDVVELHSRLQKSWISLVRVCVWLGVSVNGAVRVEIAHGGWASAGGAWGSGGSLHRLAR